MRKLIVFLLLLATSTAKAQLEIGFNLGAGTNTKPNGNLPYKGDRSPLSMAGSLKGIYNINDVLQAGIDVTLTQLKRKSDKIYEYHTGGEIGGDDKKFTLAKTYTSFCGIINAKLGDKNGYVFYAGAALGYGVARHNSKKLSNSESYRAPDGGKGMVWGAQIGMLSGISDNLGWNIEASARRLSLNYDAVAPHTNPITTMNYNLYNIMLTVGLRYCFINKKEAQEKEIQDAMNVGG